MSKKDGRRAFLQQVMMGAGATAQQPGAQIQQPDEHAPRTQPSTSRPPDIQFPRVFKGPHLKMIAFPLGGVAAGSISLGGRGQLRDWEIFNKPDKGASPPYAFPSIWVQS